MADTGHIVIEGFKAGAIKYTVLEGFVPNPVSVTLNPNLADLGFGLNSIKRVLLMGFTTGTSGPTTLNPTLADLGFGLNSIKRVLLMGFTTGGVTPPPGGSGAFYIFGDSVLG